ncbi:alpha/beta hydrolase fold domain-containing protein [Polyplosphaeria fusca]|uniref:Alpha/beta hydrolase fold domain-containing protein n=1 Tax=Polyplosphaeria fusca TaxID=682080 RepID=A0A9P4QUS2_9PLEO|nr:alpha/beta hydrolase fold domain-containing protein [Polyplosphaeria fusca]
MESESLTLADGRTLSYAIYGSPTPTTTIFYFHAFPSSRLEGRLFHDEANKLGARVIVPDRPGLGKSTFQPNRTLLDWPTDVLALADSLDIERFYVAGMSGGAPYALACVYAIPKARLAGAAVVGGLYPVSLGTAGMLMAARASIWLGARAPGVLGFLLDWTMGKAARDADPKVFEEIVMKEVQNRPEVDRDVLLEGKNKEAMVEATRESLMQGAQGAAWEAKINGSAWGFELGELGDTPLALWHGDQDVNTPPAMARKAKDMMPGAQLHMKKGEGHISLVKFKEDILRDLIKL